MRRHADEHHARVDDGNSGRRTVDKTRVLDAGLERTDAHDLTVALGRNLRKGQKGREDQEMGN